MSRDIQISAMISHRIMKNWLVYCSIIAIMLVVAVLACVKRGDPSKSWIDHDSAQRRDSWESEGNST
jgi:hypothetical protein